MAINFIKSSTVIKRLLTARAHIGKTDQDFQIWGSAVFEKARQSSFFAKDNNGFRVPVIIVAIGNNTGSVLHMQGGGEGELTHNIDVHYIAPLKDRRGQFRDEESVEIKQFLVQALHAFNPSSGANPLLYSNDSLTSINGVAGYSRTFTFTQSMIVSEDDTWGGDENEIIGPDDLDEFLFVDSDTTVDAPPLGDVSDVSELDITMRE